MPTAGNACQIGVGEWPAPAVPGRVRVLPNPVEAEGVVEWWGLPARDSLLKLCDVGGRAVVRWKLRPDERRGPARWGDLVGGRKLPAGVYFLRLRTARSSRP